VASELKYSTLVKGWIQKQSEDVSDELVKIILSDVYDGLKTQKIIEKFKPIVQKTFNNYVSELVNKKISSALEPEPDTTDENDSTLEEPQSKIVTTEEELQAYNIILAILGETIPLDKVIYRDTESYFGILYDNNNRKPICRLNLDTKRKQLLIPDEHKNFTRYYIESILDLYKYKKELIESAQRYQQ
jgi:hypothetical protein